MLSATSSKSAQQDEETVQQKEEKPEWLQAFLQRTFFSSCSNHEASKNELNKYCITCELPACRHCISSGQHGEHKILKIYRHVYKDVVPINDMERHIDCSQIQPYKCNKQLVIALNPLPHSGSQTDGEAACAVCSRRLLDPILNRYCSVACKVEAFARKTDEAEPPFLAVQTPPPDVRGKGRALGKRMNKRKGMPHRAPLS